MPEQTGFGYDVSRRRRDDHAGPTRQAERADVPGLPAARGPLLHGCGPTTRVQVVVITGKGSGFCSGGDVDEIIGAAARPGRDARRARVHAPDGRARREHPAARQARDRGRERHRGGRRRRDRARVRLPHRSPRRPSSTSSSRRSGSPAPTWAPRGCSRGSSGSGARRSGCSSATASTRQMAFDAGLVTQSSPPQRARPEALALARRLATGPLLALGMTKRLLNGEASMDLSPGDRERGDRAGATCSARRTTRRSTRRTRPAARRPLLGALSRWTSPPSATR